MVAAPAVVAAVLWVRDQRRPAEKVVVADR